MTVNIFDQVMQETLTSPEVNSTPIKEQKNDEKTKRKELYKKTREKTLLQKKNKYYDDKTKLLKLKTILDKAFKEIPDAELLRTQKRVLISKNKLYKLEYRVVRKS